LRIGCRGFLAILKHGAYGPTTSTTPLCEVAPLAVIVNG
jgi:hypothetical protein